MARLTPFFSANRTVREYTETKYIPAAEVYSKRLADKGILGKEIVEWRRSIERNWSTLRFGEARIETTGGWHLFQVQVYLGELDPEAVEVELFAESMNGGKPIRQKMIRGEHLVAARGFNYSAQVPATRSSTDYTPRIVPFHPTAQVPLEEPRIFWQR